MYGKERKINQAAEVLAAVANSCTSTLIFGSMIDAYIKCDKAEEASTLYKELIEKGYDLGAVAVSRIVNTLTVGGMLWSHISDQHTSFLLFFTLV